jgi:hypothetical protein
MAIVDAGVESGYTHFENALCVAPDGTLHLAFHVLTDRARAAGHVQSKDGGETWTLADGTPVKLPYTAEQPGWIGKGPGVHMLVGNVDVDPDGNPYVVTTHHEARPYSASLWRFVNGRWDRIELAPILLGQVEDADVQMTYYATLCFDDQGNLYIAAGTFQPPGKLSVEEEWGHPTNEVVLLYSENRGGSFQVLPISPPDPTVSNWFPSLERHAGHNRVGVPRLLYTHGEPGEGVTEIRLVTLRRK